MCVWCREEESSSHIIFQCIVARMVWSSLREATGCSWNPSYFAELYGLIMASNAQDRKLAWLGVGALAWSLWTTRNKATIEGIFLRHPADVVYKLVILLQLWKGLTRQRARPGVERLIARLKAKCAELRRAG